MVCCELVIIAMMKYLFVLTALAAVTAQRGDYDGAYSFHKFSGPVSGSIRQVPVQNSHPHYQGQAYDFVAKPDYSYAYGVEDASTGNKQLHQESRDGDAVTGQYSLVEPDGRIRVVRYTADDKNGFQASVEYLPAGTH